MKIRNLLFVLFISSQAIGGMAQAASVTASVGGSLPLLGINPALMPQVQAGTAKITWSNGNPDPNIPWDLELHGGSQASMVESLAAANTALMQDSGTGHHEEYSLDTEDRAVRVLESDEYPAQSLTVDDATGQFQTLNLTGSTQKTALISVVATGGTLTATNVRIDWVGGKIMMDLNGQKSPINGATFLPKSALNMVVFTFDPSSVEGPTRLNPQDMQLGANRDATLQAQGFIVGARGALQAINLIKGLQITPAASTFAGDVFGFTATAKAALDGINNSNGRWGQLKIVTNIVLPTAGVTTSTLGQPVSTPYTLPNGVPLRITHVSSNSISNITFSNFNAANVALSSEGLLAWFNAFAVQPNSFVNGSGLANGTATTRSGLDTRFTASQTEGMTRNTITVKTPGTKVSFSTASGEIISIGGFRQDFSRGFLNSTLGGGRWSIQNLNYTLESKVAEGDMSGAVAAVGSGADQPIPTQPATKVWNIGVSRGPTFLPLQAMSEAPSVSDLPVILQSAGFTVTSVTSSAIDFSASYVFSNMNVTATYKNYICQALACTTKVKRALDGSDTDYLGSMSATVVFRLPLTP